MHFWRWDLSQSLAQKWMTFGGERKLIGGSNGAPGYVHPLDPIFFSFSCSFWGKFTKILGSRPHLCGWRPLLWKILDPPLVQIVIH